MSIKHKIAIIITLCLLLSFVIFYFQTISSVRTENTRTTTEQTNILIESKSREIGLWMRNTINEFRLLSEMPAFKAMDMRAMTPYISNITELKNRTVGEMTDLFAYGALDGKSWVNGEHTFELLTRDEFFKIKTSSLEYIVSDPKYVDYLDSKFFMIYYPITNYSQKKETLFIGGISVDKVNELVEQIDVYGGKSWIMNSNGYVYTMNPIQFSHVMNYEDKTFLIDNINPIQTGAVKFDNSTVFYSPVPYSQQWILCTKIDDSTMFANTDKIISNMQILVISMSIFAVIVAYIVSKGIVRPINKLQESMLHVKTGSLNSYYEGENKDEIYYLGQTYNLMLDTIKDLIEQISTTEEQKRQAYLAALQAQINPHFLYNTLASLKWLAQQQGAYDVADYIESLSNFFRISLSEGAEKISLKEEIKHAESYLKIQQFRYSDKVSYSFDIDETLYSVQVPKLILQPLIENSIYHGLKYEKRLGHIEISCKRDDSFLLITVSDNGIGISDKNLEKLRQNLRENKSEGNFGLNNIRQRLVLNYDDSSELIIKSEYHAGTSITLKIPLD